ncbi:MFS transporter [Actinomycetota bacterium]|nr:MFS transporter [Actinomycetota bacterium]
MAAKLETTRWKFPILGLLMMLVLGIIYAWSIFVAPLEKEFGWTRVETSVTFTVMLVFFTIGQFTGGQLGDRIGVRKVLSLAGIILAIGFFAASFTTSLPWLYFFYGACCGFPIGLCMNNNVNTSVRWFPDRVGFINGFVIMGYGLSSMLLGPIVNWIIGEFGWQIAYRVLAILAAVMVFGFAQFYKFPEKGWVPDGHKIPADIAKGQNRGFTSGQMLRNRTFYLVFVWFVIIHIAGFMLISCMAMQSQLLGASAATAAIVVGVLGVANGLGRPGMGFISDLLPGKKRMMILDSILMLIGLICLLGLPSIMDPIIGTVIGAILIGFAFGGSVSIVIGTIREFYGSKMYGANIGILAWGDLPAGIFGPMIGASIFASTGAYTNAFILAAVLCIPGIIIPLFTKAPKLDDSDTSIPAVKVGAINAQEASD